MMPNHWKTNSVLPALVAASLTLAAAGQAEAADKFKVTSVDCEMFFNWRHTPVLHYDIVEERKPDYNANPNSDYFQQAATRTAAYCERTSVRPETPMAPPRKIRGVWFESNDGQFKLLFDLDREAVDSSAGIVNAFGDRYAAKQRAAAQYAARIEELKTREARAQELKATAERIAQNKATAQKAREDAFLRNDALQISRLGTKVVLANFARIQDVRDNPFHFKRLGLAVVGTTFHRMRDEKTAEFGNDLAPIILHIDDPDRFVRSGEMVMLAFRVDTRVEIERTYGSLPEIIVSAVTQEPIYGVYVGAYSCPASDCGHLLDPPPPT